MKRLVVLALVAVVAASAPVRAEEQVVQGHIVLSALTPTIPRLAYLASDRANGMTGWVSTLEPSAERRSYEIVPLEGGSGAVDLDVWFYYDLEGQLGMGEPCARDAEDLVGGGERGTVCPGAAYAVVVLFSGVSQSFRLSIT